MYLLPRTIKYLKIMARKKTTLKKEQANSVTDEKDQETLYSSMHHTPNIMKQSFAKLFNKLLKRNCDLNLRYHKLFDIKNINQQIM